MKYIVYEYTEKASPQYVGHRFMTIYNESQINPNACNEGRLKVVGKDLSDAEAFSLCGGNTKDLLDKL